MNQILNVPFVSRYGEAGQRLDCGACCVAMLLGAMAQPAPAQDIVAASQGASGRLSPAALIRGARAFGLTLFQDKGLALNDLKLLLDDGQPPIALVKYSAIPDRQERKCRGEHSVVVVGYDDRAGLVFVNDPHYPEAGEAGSGGYRRPYTYQTFVGAWSSLGCRLLVPVPVPTPAPQDAGLSFALPASLGDVWVVAPLGLLLRPQADVPVEPGAAGAPFGQHLSALSQESTPDAGGRTWQHVLTDHGISGWVAASAGGERYLANTPPIEPCTVYVLDTPPVRQVGGLSVREARDVNARRLESVPIGGQLVVYQRVTEADGTPWLWIKSPGGDYGWAREKAEGVVMVASGGQAGTAPPAISGFLIAQPDVRQLPLAPAAPLSLPPGASQHMATAAAIWNAYGGLLEPLAARLGIDPAAAVAVVAAESGGRGFGPDGRMIIRFENHIFWHNWGKYQPETFKALFQFDANQPWKGHTYRPGPDAAWQECHRNQAEEWSAFGVAQRLDDRAAKLSISMGLPQIMGFNYASIGYPTVEAMFDAFGTDERAHLIGFFDFVKGARAVSQRIAALQARDFVRFALHYNGQGQETIYGAIIQRYDEAFRALKS